MNSVAFKKFLLDRGVRQVDLARRIGVTRGAISQVVNGIAWNSNVREQMAEILGVSPDDLPFNPAVMRGELNATLPRTAYKPDTVLR